MGSDSDRDLAAAIQAGDEDAAHRFDQRFRRRIEAIAWKRGVPQDDCCDVAQEVLSDSVRQLREGRFRGAASLSTWLYPIINGKLADYWRARRGPEIVSLGACRARAGLHHPEFA